MPELHLDPATERSDTLLRSGVRILALGMRWMDDAWSPDLAFSRFDP